MAGYIGSKAVNLSTTGADIAGDVDVSGGLTVDTNTLHVDSTNNRVGVGTISPSDVLHVVTPTFGGMTLECTGATADPTFKFLGDSGNYWSLQQDASQGDSFQFRYNNSEKIRLDASGNLLVGTTDSNAANNSANSSADNGIVAKSDGQLQVAQYQATAGSGAISFFNRTGTDGSIITFKKSGADVGSIGVNGTVLTVNATQSGYGRLGSLSNTGYLWYTNGASNGGSIYPSDDNKRDLGEPSVRFQDIYATNGTIQTSDRNEKQDIAELTDAEQRVAVAAKGLMRKFRWKNRVAEKGDDARIHCGVIAQDLQAAFAAEGLDAGDYAMFISTTWWEHDVDVPAVEAVAEVLDEEGNVVTEAVEAVDAYTRTDTYNTQEEAPEGATERTRLGVRYSELLAFIIGAL